MEEIDLKELFYSLWKSKKIIIFVTVIALTLGILYQCFFVTPMYRSVTSLVLAKGTNADSETENTQGITSSDITLNQKLVSTYGEIIKSRSVANEVIEKLNLNMSEDAFISNITVKSKEDTELLEIMVSNKDPKASVAIANSLAEVFANKVAEVYNINNVSVIDVAEESAEPYNINWVKTLAIFTFVGLFLSCLIVFIKFYFNNTINNEEDIEKGLGLPVLAVIPKYEDK